MKQMVMLVLNNPDDCMAIMDAWEAAGAPGITILESSGLVRMRRAGARDDLPLLPSLRDLFQGGETHNRTIFSVVEDEAQAQAIVEATGQVFAQLPGENSSVLYVLPVTESHRFSTSGSQSDRQH